MMQALAVESFLMEATAHSPDIVNTMAADDLET